MNSLPTLEIDYWKSNNLKTLRRYGGLTGILQTLESFGEGIHIDGSGNINFEIESIEEQTVNLEEVSPAAFACFSHIHSVFRKTPLHTWLRATRFLGLVISVSEFHKLAYREEACPETISEFYIPWLSLFWSDCDELTWKILLDSSTGDQFSDFELVTHARNLLLRAGLPELSYFRLESILLSKRSDLRLECSLCGTGENLKFQSKISLGLNTKILIEKLNSESQHVINLEKCRFLASRLKNFEEFTYSSKFPFSELFNFQRKTPKEVFLQLSLFFVLLGNYELSSYSLRLSAALDGFQLKCNLCKGPMILA